MIKILVFSDSHKRTKSMIEAVEFNLTDLNQIIHLGDNISDAKELQKAFPDIPVAAVSGNCDCFSDKENEKTFSLGDKKFYITHGHTRNVKLGVSFLAAYAKAKSADIALFGHTHIPFSQKSNGIYVFNPGSIAEPRASYRPSYGIITIDGENTEFEHVFLDN